MITVGNAILSEDIADKFFVCDLTKCKGACCVEGDQGAPLLEEELQILTDNYKKIKPYLSRKGARAIKEQGLFVKDEDGDFSTPTISKRECAYSLYDKGVLKCGIEQAFLEGAITFQKPISCHLYPIRITKYDQFEALNYERWSICSDACSNGKSLGVPLYKFLKNPLIRKYGSAWYEELILKIEVEKKPE